MRRSAAGEGGRLCVQLVTIGEPYDKVCVVGTDTGLPVGRARGAEPPVPAAAVLAEPAEDEPGSAAGVAGTSWSSSRRATLPRFWGVSASIPPPPSAAAATARSAAYSRRRLRDGMRDGRGGGETRGSTANRVHEGRKGRPGCEHSSRAASELAAAAVHSPSRWTERDISARAQHKRGRPKQSKQNNKPMGESRARRRHSRADEEGLGGGLGEWRRRQPRWLPSLPTTNNHAHLSMSGGIHRERKTTTTWQLNLPGHGVVTMVMVCGETIICGLW